VSPAAIAAPTALVSPTIAEQQTPVVVSERSGKPKTAPSARSAAIPTEASAAGLEEEVRQLRRIERAIRDGNPRLALAIGDNLDRDIPGGQLLLERRAAHLMAGCQLDASAGAPEAARFLADNPHTAYAPRLRALCELTQDEQRNGAAPGTNSAQGGGTR
jgi:hypothetical protein